MSCDDSLQDFGHLVKVVIVIYMAALWSNDVLRPAVSTPLAIFDNYEIYDLVFTNVSHKKDSYLYSSAIQTTVYKNQSIRYITSVDLPNPLGITNNADLSNPTAEAIFLISGVQGYYTWLVAENYQTTVYTTPESLVFTDTETSKFKEEVYAVQRYTPYGAANTDLIYTLFDEFKSYPTSTKIEWKQLIINEDLTYTGIAQDSGLFALEYWSHNYLEGHPKITKTLDYIKLKVRLTKGKQFSFKLWHPVAHTLKIPTELQSATAAGKPLLTDMLFDNRIYANSIPVNLPPPSQPPTGFVLKLYRKDFYNPDATYNPSTGISYGVYSSVEWRAPDNPEYEKTYEVSTYQWKDYRVLRATNQVIASTWGVDADVGDYPNFSLTQINEWHFDPQPDGSNGAIVMDSIRTIQTLEIARQIADAIDAGTYATDPATGAPRVANLGHLLEKVANFIGYRPEPDGSIDMQKETTTYAAAVVSAKFNSGVDYHAGRFGKKGALVRRAPNKLGATGKWEPGGYVKVHDLFQLHTELFGQMNQALNLQDSTSITIRDGSNTYSYPNQLALLSEIGTGVLQHRRQIREIWASSIVTQKTVNEVLAGFGLPVVNKSLTMNGQQLPYWGIQPSQSLQKEIATATYQGGAQLGQLL
jgi:hypothetical protein